ncbi:hypothetical protein BJX62DRAFT_200765 [Aspergillus germanicus]
MFRVKGSVVVNSRRSSCVMAEMSMRQRVLRAALAGASRYWPGVVGLVGGEVFARSSVSRPAVVLLATVSMFVGSKALLSAIL